MTKPVIIPETFAEQRKLLQELEQMKALPIDDVLRVASRVTVELGDQGLAAFQQKRFEEALDCYRELVSVWTNILEALPDDKHDSRPNLQKVADYWKGRSEEAKRQKAIHEAEMAAKAQQAEEQSRSLTIPTVRSVTELDRPAIVRGIGFGRGRAIKNSTLKRKDRRPGFSDEKTDSGRWKR